MVEKTRNSVTLTKIYQDALQELIERGIFLDKQAGIRDALREQFFKYKIKPFYPRHKEDQ